MRELSAFPIAIGFILLLVWPFFLAEAYEEMIDALIDLTKEYKELVDSGDCGFWEPENVDAFQKAKEALKKAGVE